MSRFVRSLQSDFISLFFNAEVKKLQDAGHNVYWFENGWYHSHNCPICQIGAGTPVYEFRCRLNGDNRKWEDIPATKEDCHCNLCASIHARDLKIQKPAIKEVRYNRFGSKQGHYF